MTPDQGPRVYIASAYTADDPAYAVTRQQVVADLLQDAGMHPVIPLLCHYRHEHHPREWEEWMAYCLGELATCNAVLRIGGLPSKGADAEVEWAKDHGIPVHMDILSLCDWAEDWWS